VDAILTNKIVLAKGAIQAANVRNSLPEYLGRRTVRKVLPPDIGQQTETEFMMNISIKWSQILKEKYF